MKVPIAAAVSAAVVFGSAWLVNNVLQLFPDKLPTEVLLWIRAGVFGVLLAVFRFPSSRWWSRIGGVAAALLLLVAAGSQVNIYYGQYPTVGQVATAMDGFAARHHGLAPVVVAVDPNGSTFGNTMCMDTRRGNAETYLTRTRISGRT